MSAQNQGADDPMDQTLFGAQKMDDHLILYHRGSPDPVQSKVAAHDHRCVDPLLSFVTEAFTEILHRRGSPYEKHTVQAVSKPETLS